MGAWIETNDKGSNKAKESVAPYVGAWIETVIRHEQLCKMKSHPTWVRGLKLLSKVR